MPFLLFRGSDWGIEQLHNGYALPATENNTCSCSHLSLDLLVAAELLSRQPVRYCVKPIASFANPPP